MWFAPAYALPAEGEPVICVTDKGDVVWLKRVGDDWLESDALGQNRGNLHREPVMWTHSPRLREVPGVEIARNDRYRERMRNPSTQESTPPR